MDASVGSLCLERQKRRASPGLHRGCLRDAANVHHFCISAILHCMKATVTITSRGVVTLPAKLRQALGLKADDQLIAETTPEGLLLRPAVTLPVELYTPDRAREFDEAEADLAAWLQSRAARRKKTAKAVR